MGLVVSRWRKDGQDRLYVNDDATREGIGFYDHHTGRLTLRDETRSLEVLEALRPFLTGPEALPHEPHSAAPQNPASQNPAAQHSASQDPSSLDPAPHGLAPQDAAPQDVVPQNAVPQNVVPQDPVPPTLRPSGIASVRELGLSTVAALSGRPRKPRGRAQGERVVDKRLGRLRRDGWAVLSPLPKGREGDVGHLLIGQPGVFTVTARNHPDAVIEVGEDSVTVSGTQHPYLRECRRGAAFAERILGAALGTPVPVTPVLALVGAASIETHASRGDVLVLPGEDLDTILRERLAVYSIQERDRLVAEARRPEIWPA